MSKDLKADLKDLKKRMSQQKEVILAQPLEKIDPEKQGEAFSGFVSELLTEFQKSSGEYKYIEAVYKEFDGMRLADIRFALEKSYDRYDKILSLMKRYEENFDEKEFAKYTGKHMVLEKMLNYMLGNAMGEYKKVEEEHVE
jgi:hypothetical protein